MAFTHAIYYPWIEIEDTAWLKTAVLYWDKISTIAPRYYEKKYENLDMAFLQDAKILVPEFVHPEHQAVNEASENFLEYISTNEAVGVLLPPGTKYYKIPKIGQASELARLNKYKIDKHLRIELLRSGRVLDDGEWLILDKESINYYMTLLASSVSRQKNFAPLTDSNLHESLSNRVRRGDSPVLKSQDIGEGLLAKMTLDFIGIDPETPYDDIVRFRDDYKAELGRFRTEIGSLAQAIDPNTPSIEALNQQILDIYTNRIEPAVSNLRDVLHIAKIRSFITQLSSSIFAAAVPFFPKDNPINLIASGSYHVTAQGINFALNKKDQLSQNPYSFVLKVEQHLS